MSSLINKLASVVSSFFLNKDERAFIEHNKEIWRADSNRVGEGHVLVEETALASNVLAISYIANFLCRKTNSKIVAYTKKSQVLLPRSVKEVYESFNAKFLYFSNSHVLAEAETLFNEVYPTLKTKRDVENIRIGGMLIGDLVYDTHLRKHLVPTVELECEEFKKTLIEALSFFLYWKKYFDKNTVSSVIVSHCVYAWNAIILRVAVDRSIPVYQVTAQRVYYITDSHNYRAYNDFLDYPVRFSGLGKEEKKTALALAKERLDLRFSGKVGVDMHYSTKSAYTTFSQDGRVIQKSPRLKLLIAPHCFFDAPHPYGISLFPDFFEWIAFLGGISEETDYDWYLKTHPDFLPGNLAIIDEFVNKYPKFKLIDSRTSHNQIIEEGIDFALTVHGTIGFEYAAKGVTVINASMCNPHIAYDFNIHPRSQAEYEHVLLNLDQQSVSVDLNKVYEYYYCRFIGTYNDWLFDSYGNFIDAIGGHASQVKSVSYDQFLSEFTVSKHKKVMRTVANFIESGDYCIGHEHRGSVI